MVMEVQNTARKRLAVEEAREGEDSARIKKLKKGEEQGEDAEAAPTDEEVEEFFAILRRMKVAVDYFDQKGKGGREWRRELLEQTEDALDDVDGREDDASAVNKSTGSREVFSE
ncbi:uncharacterized protein LOC130965260 isoform X3 [Arachis stenosperma]|uniref:uncharacterized protein LOC130965260 isoform X3 n=1 Tax=Arachis stenosperma TaxID=217475 RepID=UPI0025AC4425|nr:uncharacterized protein LOC130965260 isoform X3 [Arachis stenosperma]